MVLNEVSLNTISSFLCVIQKHGAGCFININRKENGKFPLFK